MPTFALIHSPLVSPFTWQSTAQALSARGHVAVVPDLLDTPAAGPFWRQHAAAAAQVINALPPSSEPLVLVAHSGAGALLPSIGQALQQPVSAYLFVDAGWPAGGQTRLQSFGPDEVESFRAFLAAGGRFPDWQADDLAGILPDAAVRAQLVAELRPRGLDYWDEPLPVAPGWPDAPVGYLRYTDTYRPDADQAAAHGWPVRAREAGHFEMLAQPEVVAEELVTLAALVLDLTPHG